MNSVFHLPTSRSLPLIEQSGAFAFPQTTTDRAKEVGLPSELFLHLPHFDEITLDEIVDIRRELSSSLARFRSAMIGFSRTIQAMPWEDLFPHEADQIYRESVVPAIQDINDECKSNRLLSKLLKRAIRPPLEVPSAAGIGILLSKASSFPDVWSQVLGLGLGAAALSNQALEDWKEKARGIERNQMYFSYGLSRRLGK